MTQKNFVLDFLRKVFQAVKTFRMYGGNHPQSQENLKSFGEAVDSFPGGTVTIVFHGNTLLVQDVAQPARDQAVSFLAGCLSARSITSFSLHPGISCDEIFQLVKILAAKPEEVVEGDDLKKALQERFRNVTFNRIRYVAVKETEKVVGASEAPALAHPGKSLTQSVEGLAEALERAGFSGGGPGGSRPPPGGKPTLDRSSVPRTTPELLDFVAQRVVPGMTSAWQQLTEIVDQLPKSVRIVLDKADKSAVRAAIIASQLQSGLEPEVVRKTFQELAPERKDAMLLFDALAKAMPHSGKVLSGESLKQLITFLPRLDEFEEACQGRVLVVSGNAEHCAAVKGALADLAYSVDTASTAKEAIDKIGSAESLDAIALETALPDKRGTVILSSLQSSGKVIPVVLFGEKAARDASEFEVFSYPKKMIIPSEDPKLVAHAVGEFAGKGGERSVEARKEDQDQAREIQRKLVPAELPELKGWELDLLHHPAEDLGGDLIDVFRIDEERIGILLGEVLGRGTAAALVMVMMRSTFRLSVSNKLSPAALIARVNRLLTPEMRRSMFVTMVFASAHLQSGRISLVNCGHNPPVLHHPSEGTLLVPATRSLPLGMTAVEKFESALKQEELEVPPGGQLLFYTRGVIEAIHERHESLSQKRLLEAVKRWGSGTARDLLEALQADIAARRGSSPLRSSDLTLLAMRRAPA